MTNALIIVWRESLEALLIVGILLAWGARQPDAARMKRGLWAGVGLGVLLALALGLATFAAQSAFSGAALEQFQIALMLLAAALMVQMVFWMHRHGRSIKRELENQADSAVGLWSLVAVAALAVAREGAETVVFLYGLGLEGGAALPGLLLAALAGLLLAAATAWLLARGARHLNTRVVFGVSEILLLLIAHALLITGVERLIGADVLPPLIDPAFDLSAWLADSHGIGRMLADFAGYRARPAGMQLVAAAVYWTLVYGRMKRTP